MECFKIAVWVNVFNVRAKILEVAKEFQNSVFKIHFKEPQTNRTKALSEYEKNKRELNQSTESHNSYTLSGGLLSWLTLCLEYHLQSICMAEHFLSFFLKSGCIKIHYDFAIINAMTSRGTVSSYSPSNTFLQ